VSHYGFVLSFLASQGKEINQYATFKVGMCEDGCIPICMWDKTKNQLSHILAPPPKKKTKNKPTWKCLVKKVLGDIGKSFANVCAHSILLR
jgi:hypothetical protein